MNVLEQQDWTFPVPIAYGPGRLREIAGICRNAGLNNPLVVTDKGSSELWFISQISQFLYDGGLNSDIYAGISPNPRDDEIGAGRDLFVKGQHDGVIAVGGGSGMDGGKAIAVVANNDFDLWHLEFENERLYVTNRP